MRIPTTYSQTNGSALLIVLVMLSLMISLGMGFSLLVSNSRKSGGSYLHQIRSQDLATAGLKQAIAILRTSYDPGDTIHDDDDLFPATAPGDLFYAPVSGPFAGRSYRCSTSSDDTGISEFLAVSMAGKTFIADAVMDIDSPDTPIDDDRGYLIMGTDSEVIGRIAYMIIDESGKLDPNSVAFGTDSEATGSVTRVGISDSEICLQDATLSAYEDYTKSGAERWHSLREIARELSPPDFETQVVQVISPYSLRQHEYWNDNDNDAVCDTGELYERIDLGTQGTTSADLARHYKAFVAPDDLGTALPDIGDLSDANDCDWLKQLGANGVAATGAERRRIAAQIAVNVVDYVDGDSNQTIAWVDTAGQLTLTDPGAGNAEVKVRGRENQYGISEIAIKLEAGISGSDPYDLDIDTSYKVEIFFPAGVDEPRGSHRVWLDYTVTVYSALSGFSSFSFSDNDSSEFDNYVNEAGGTLRYFAAWEFMKTHSLGNFIGSDGKYTITNFQIDSMRLGDGTDDIDVFPAQAGHANWWNWSSPADLTGNNRLYASVEAFDPLNNEQDEADVVPGWGSLWRARPPGTATMYVNDESNVGMGELTRAGTTPGVGPPAISAYSDIVVKNGLFNRIGEIGRVGSYWPGRSLRLWAATAGDEPGTDTAILDLFRIGSAPDTRGTVNINSVNADVLTALLTGTTTVSTAAAVQAIIDRRATPVTFTNIGDVFAIAGVSGADNTQDAVEEAMVEKVAELINIRNNYFTIVVGAQSVHDRGNEVIYKDLNHDGDTIDAGETINTVLGQYDPNGDDIVDTTRLLAVVRRDAFTGACTVEHIEYIDD